MLGLHPRGQAALETSESLLPSVRSAREEEFFQLDGYEVTNMMANTASVQFTVDVTPENAVHHLNNLGASLPEFLLHYRQDKLWKRYVRESKAGYRPDRYGGPVRFDSLHDYCGQLARHRVISSGRLVAYEEATDFDPHQFIKSIWWYFRLKRYGDQLCIEIRPQERRSDESFGEQLEFALAAMEA